MPTWRRYTPKNPCSAPPPWKKAQVISWDHHLFVTLFSAAANMLRNKSKSMHNRALPGDLDIPQIPELVERGALQIGHILPKLDAHLASSPWVAGETFTFADIDLVVAVDFLAWVKQSVPEECTHLKAWYTKAQTELA